MAASPRFKIYYRTRYVGAIKLAQEAAMLVACLGEEATIRDGHSPKRIVWREGFEDQSAGESYDHVLDVIETRAEEFART